MNNEQQKIMLSSTESTKDGAEWATPQEFFDKMNAKFGFTLDAAASEKNHKCSLYFTKEQDGLTQDWGQHVVWCNPPYGRQISKWLKKGREAAANGATVVFLIPSRTDTRWFHEDVVGVPGCTYELLKGRLKFEHKNGTCDAAPFPSMLVIFRPPTGNLSGGVSLSEFHQVGTQMKTDVPRIVIEVRVWAPKPETGSVIS